MEELGVTHTDNDITDNGPLTLEDLTTPTSSTTRGANNTQYASMTREVARNLEAEFDANMTVLSEAVFLLRSREDSNETPRTPPRVQELSMEADSKSNTNTNTNKNRTLATSTFTPTITPTPVLDYLPESVTVREHH